METKFTKGEWQISNDEPEKNEFGVYGLDIDFNSMNKKAATIWMQDKYPDDEEEANAKLISAAPELLESLSELVEWLKIGDYDKSFLEKAENAIKKATE